MRAERECSVSKTGKHKRFIMTEERFNALGVVDALFYCVVCDACSAMLVDWRNINA